MKFFENRANGQSKGFCVISLGCEQSMRMVLERLPKRELHGQLPVVTLPTKQALNKFESQCKTRSTPTTNTGQRGHQGNPHQGPIGRANSVPMLLDNAWVGLRISRCMVRSCAWCFYVISQGTGFLLSTPRLRHD